jgi:5,10-methylene-tetrahydrofolate dehydrogenase/methenyl tetrahydrofolate cyclohydrolase
MDKYSTHEIDILGATPQAAFHILDHYGLGDLHDKKITIV